MTSTAVHNHTLLIVDVQNDFCEGGALGVTGGGDVAAKISAYLRANPGRYTTVIASRDWHDPDNDNGGHFADGEPNFTTTWPVHCVAGTPGAEYHPDLDTSLITHHVYKGQGVPAYSMFEGATEDGQTVLDIAEQAKGRRFDVVGIATDYCVLATVSDALAAPNTTVRVLTDLTAGVATRTSIDAVSKMHHDGAFLYASTDV